MRICFLINSLWNAGGTERMATVVANELVRNHGVEVDFVGVNSGEAFFEPNKNIRIFNLNPERESNIFRRYPRNVARLRRILRRERYDYLIDVCTAMTLMSIPAARGLKTKIISWEHFNAGINWNLVSSRLARHMAARFAYRVVVLTNGDKKIYEQKFGARNVVRIANPVTIEEGIPSPLSEKCFLAIGRFTPQKGFDMLLDAWAGCDCRKNGWRLRIVGSGELQQQHEKQIQSLRLEGSVTMEPPTKDVLKLYREASVYVLSSRFEGLPLVLIEASAMGLPVVGFDCETGPRDIVVNGKTGILVPPQDVKGLTSAIDSIASDPETIRSFAQGAIDRSKDFSLPEIIQQWVNLLGI